MNPQDPRLGDLIKNLDSPSGEKDFVIFGYPEDQGISQNGGRPGAAGAPDVIRTFFKKMTPHPFKMLSGKLFDGGNITGHENAYHSVFETLNRNSKVITLGGGHDYGFPDTCAFVEATLKRNEHPVVINFDAHLDVRPTDKGFHSGTPFRRLLEKHHKNISFFEVGLQPWCNAKSHLQWLEDHGGSAIFIEECIGNPTALLEVLERRIFSKVKKGSRLALSIDIDGFASSSAPGASQVFPMGLDPNSFLLAWPRIAQFKPDLLGIYEVSPPFDHDNRTSRLASILMHLFIFQ